MAYVQAMTCIMIHDELQTPTDTQNIYYMTQTDTQ